MKKTYGEIIDETLQIAKIAFGPNSKLKKASAKKPALNRTLQDINTSKPIKEIKDEVFKPDDILKFNEPSKEPKWIQTARQHISVPHVHNSLYDIEIQNAIKAVCFEKFDLFLQQSKNNISMIRGTTHQLTIDGYSVLALRPDPA